MAIKKVKTTKKKSSQRKNNKSLTLIPAPIREKQLMFILQKTPKEHIYQRPGKGGGEWDYVTGIYVKKVLNYAFGWMWDFQIIDKGKEGDLIWTQGRLTIKNKTGKPMIVKEQFGRAEIKFQKGKPHDPKFMVDYGNDLKAAATDALKKCASELGVASDVYGKNEFREIKTVKADVEGDLTENQRYIKATQMIDACKKVSQLNEWKKNLTTDIEEQRETYGENYDSLIKRIDGHLKEIK